MGFKLLKLGIRLGLSDAAVPSRLEAWVSMRCDRSALPVAISALPVANHWPAQSIVPVKKKRPGIEDARGER